MSKHALPNAGKPQMVPDEPFTFQVNMGEAVEEIPLRNAVYQAIGAASVCWSVAPTGVFMDQRAREIADALLQVIDRDIDRSHE